MMIGSAPRAVASWLPGDQFGRRARYRSRRWSGAILKQKTWSPKPVAIFNRPQAPQISGIRFYVSARAPVN